MSASRDAILARLRAAGVPPADPPDLAFDRVRFPDPVQRFAEALSEAGGRCELVPDGTPPDRALRALPQLEGARRIFSGVAGLPSDAPSGSLRELAELDLAVLPGAPAVAESGAVWLVPADVTQRAAAFLAQHLVLWVPRSEVVHELHEAYARIDPAASSFGCFVAGPSKTADIEQALVIGAHGPRSLSVLLYGPNDPASVDPDAGPARG